MKNHVRVPLLLALLLLLAAALVTSLVPAAVALDRRVNAELRRTAMEDLGRAPMILESRQEAEAEALAMHAMSVAAADGLVEAVAAGRLQEAATIARTTAAAYDEDAILVASDGSSVVGPLLPPSLIDVLRAGGSAVEYVYRDGIPRAVALAPLQGGEGWIGAAGSATELGQGLATTLSALARADVTIVGPDGNTVASTLEPSESEAVVQAEAGGPPRGPDDKVREVSAAGEATWMARGELGDAGTVLFSRTVAEELHALSAVRGGALLAGLLTLALALGVGSLVALALIRPVRGLAEAAGRIAEGDFESPVPSSRLEEIDRLGSSFRTMRESLRSRLQELAQANQALEERQRKLGELQAELIRQDRMASSARMAAELAHEIRNPVANVRNCLEVVRRGLPEGSDGSRFADMAIDELLRMHELAEHLLDLNRPADPAAGGCDAAAVSRQVASLVGVGETPVRVDVEVLGPGPTDAALPPDALKQILFNLVENAWEAAGSESTVEVRIRGDGSTVALEVLDRGPGIAEDVLPHVFDPFFTTKDAVTGVGLGLSVAHGLVRRYGGQLTAGNRTDTRGAIFKLELPTSREATS
jgi:signal transduction histidine kinase